MRETKHRTLKSDMIMLSIRNSFHNFTKCNTNLIICTDRTALTALPLSLSLSLPVSPHLNSNPFSLPLMRNCVYACNRESVLIFSVVQNRKFLNDINYYSPLTLIAITLL